MSDNEISLTVKTSQGLFNKTYNKTTKLSQVMQDVIAHFGFTQNNTFALVLEGDEDNDLNLERTIVSYQFEDGTILKLTDIGVAV